MLYYIHLAGMAIIKDVITVLNSNFCNQATSNSMFMNISNILLMTCEVFWQVQATITILLNLC